LTPLPPRATEPQGERVPPLAIIPRSTTNLLWNATKKLL
jgi:hypothetical protein